MCFFVPEGVMKSWFLAVGIVAGLVAHPSSAAAAAGPTFTRDVAPIVFDKCASCHRPGEVVRPGLRVDERVHGLDRAEMLQKAGRRPFESAGSEFAHR